MNNFGWTNMLQIHLQSFSVMNRQIVRYVDLFSKNPMKLKTYNYLSLQFHFTFVVITHPQIFVLLQVLLWLKQWDSCVFGSEIRSTSEEVLSALRRHSTISQNKKQNDSSFTRKNRGNRWSNGNFRNSNNLEYENSNSKGIQDSWHKKTRSTGPPEQKVSYNSEKYIYIFLS